MHFRPKTPPPSEHSPSEESSESDSEEEQTNSNSELLSYPFPPEATSICVDIEPVCLDNEPPFTSEFNISDYFSVDTLSNFNVALATSCSTDPLNSGDWQTNELGCSHVLVLPEVGNVFAPQVRLQCSDSTNSMSTLNSTTSPIWCASNHPLIHSTSMSTQCTSVSIETQKKQYKQLSNISNVTSILSKSLTSPSNNKNSGTSEGKLLSATGTISGSNCVMHYDTSHQNGPKAYVENSKNLSNSTHTVNNQSTIVLPQKHPPFNFLSSLNKLDNFNKSQQQTQNQTQQVPTSGEITLNNNR